MSELGKYHETESLGNNQYQTAIGVKPIAFLQSTGYKRINPNWQEAGDGRFVVDNAPFRVLTYSTGERRVYPIRDDFDRWIEIGRPHTKVVTLWQAMDHGALACKDNVLSGSRINTGLDIVHGGHFISWELELKSRPLLGVWKPLDNLLTFPYELRGLDFKGDALYADGKPVMRMRSPIVSDLDGEEDVRPVKWSHQTIDGQRCLLYTLPDISGMKRPVVDPTLELQPDAAAGKDTLISQVGVRADYNYGVNANAMQIGRAADTWIARSLWFMSLSAIPSAATCSSATLTLTNNGNAAQTAAVTLKAYCILAANTGWVEGTKNGDVEAGSCCWNDHTYQNVQEWAGSAGLSTPNTDYNSSELASHAIGDDVAGTTYDISLATAQVKNWFGSNDNNHGVFQRAPAETTNGVYAEIAGSDNGTAAERPKLVVVYTLPGAGARLLNLTPFNHKRRVF